MFSSDKRKKLYLAVIKLSCDNFQRNQMKTQRNQISKRRGDVFNLVWSNQSRDAVDEAGKKEEEKVINRLGKSSVTCYLFKIKSF